MRVGFHSRACLAAELVEPLPFILETGHLSWLLLLLLLLFVVLVLALLQLLICDEHLTLLPLRLLLLLLLVVMLHSRMLHMLDGSMPLVAARLLLPCRRRSGLHQQLACGLLRAGRAAICASLGILGVSHRQAHRTGALKGTSNSLLRLLSWLLLLLQFSLPIAWQACLSDSATRLARAPPAALRGPGKQQA
jgi:hypothetical protein